LFIDSLLLMAGALLGGFVNGLSGFGTTLVALPFWVHAVPPVVAAQLGAALGVVGHLRALPTLWPLVDWRKVAPYIFAGLIGVPIGTTLLPQLDPGLFKRSVGTILVAFCLFQLVSRDRLRFLRGGWPADAVVGLIGGFLGGLAGMSGPVPTLWASLRGLAKDDKRALFFAFNLTMLAAMLAASAAQGLLSWELGRVTLISLPAALLGTHLGQLAYARLDVRRFDRIVLGLLLLSGVSLLWSNS
jgi:uncharacterized protein